MKSDATGASTVHTSPYHEPVELAQLPFRHIRLCAVVGAVQTHTRQYRGFVRPRSLPSRLLRPDQHCQKCFPVRLLAFGVVTMASAFVSAVSSEIDRAETPRFTPTMFAAELATSRVSKLKLANFWSSANFHRDTLCPDTHGMCDIHVCNHDRLA